MRKARFLNKYAIFSVIYSIAAGVYSSAAAEDYQSEAFLKRTTEERKWFYNGAFMALGQVASQKNPQQAQCIWNWYFENPQARIPMLEASLRQYKNYAPTNVFIALVQEDCGKF